MAGTGQDVYALVGIACVREDLLLLFVPGVHQVPVESQVALDRWSAGQGAWIAPGRIFGHAGASANCPVRRFPFQGREATVFSRLQQIHAHIFQRKVEDRQPSKFMQEHDMHAISHGDASEDHTDTPAAVFPAKPQPLTE